MEIKAEDIAGKKIAVLGAGRSGCAAAQLLLKKGARVFISDNNTSAEVQEACNKLSQNYPVLFQSELGRHSDTIFTFRDLLVVSPGIGLDNPVISKAQEKKIPVFGELEVTSWFCRNPIIAVTGTNGKSTVLMMLDAIFQAADCPGRVAGNIGTAFAEIVDELKPDETVLLEVSSYQLETIKTFHPHIAVILNISPDHMHRHKTMNEYLKSKLRIGENQIEDDVLIFNHNDPYLLKVTAPGRAQRVWFDNQSTVANGAGLKNDTLCLFMNGQETAVLPSGDIPVPGVHNIDNALTAIAASGFAGIEPVDIHRGLKQYKGLEHRLEHAGSVKGVNFINDSKATNIDSTMAAIRSFPKPVILIAGGEDKGSDLSVANHLMKERVKMLVLIGEAAERMDNAWGKTAGASTIVKNIQDAVYTAFKKAKSGDIVLLSPGCASFDMFKNYEERGRVFTHIVKSLGKKIQ